MRSERLVKLAKSIREATNTDELKDVLLEMLSRIDGLEDRLDYE